MERHKAIIPCERGENSSKLHTFYDTLDYLCRNTCVSENLLLLFFFLTKCSININL